MTQRATNGTTAAKREFVTPPAAPVRPYLPYFDVRSRFQRFLHWSCCAFQYIVMSMSAASCGVFVNPSKGPGLL